MTAHGDEEISQRCLGAGAVAFLDKPFHGDALLDDPSIQADLRLALTSAIEELPAAYGSVLVLRDVRGRPYHSGRRFEVARSVGVRTLE